MVSRRARAALPVPLTRNDPTVMDRRSPAPIPKAPHASAISRYLHRLGLARMSQRTAAMDRRGSLALAGLAAGALVAAILAACATPAPADAEGSAAAVTQRTFDRNNVLDDKSMRDPEAMTAGDVQKFLEKTPWGTKSALASYTENGKTAAQIMVEMATSHGVNPLEMLVRVQMEQGLVSKTSTSPATIAIAFGCGCPHSPVCSDKYMGFTNQADCAAGTLRRSMDKAVTTAGTVSGWARNKSKDTEDGLNIVPANAVTAALYTYTPWVGEAGGGRTGVGGVSLHAQVWDRFAEFVSYGEWAVPSTTGGPSEGPATSPDPTPAPTADPPAPPPTTTADAGKGTDAGSRPDSGTTGSGSTGAPEDGSEDSKILGGGSSPPASNAPPPSTMTPPKPKEYGAATEADLARKPKSDGGCSMAPGAPRAAGTAQRGDTGPWLAAAVALSLIVSRRRRSAT